jgi:hypothetical protein
VSKLRGAEDSQAHQREHEHRNFERDRNPEQHEADEAVVVTRANLDVVVRRVVVGQEVDRRVQDHEVAEQDSAEPEQRREGNRHEHRALAPLFEGGREERPQLPEDDRQRKQQPGPEADQDRGRERLDRA